MILVHSISGHLYNITFIYDFSRNTWIYHLQHKDESFKMFKDFKALVENQTRKEIKIFRSNNGGVYILKEFTNSCKKEGINKEMIMPYTPKQNRVVERKKSSIAEVIRAMLLD